jgi:hypothetical protein
MLQSSKFFTLPRPLHSAMGLPRSSLPPPYAHVTTANVKQRPEVHVHWGFCPLSSPQYENTRLASGLKWRMTGKRKRDELAPVSLAKSILV